MITNNEFDHKVIFLNFIERMLGVWVKNGSKLKLIRILLGKLSQKIELILGRGCRIEKKSKIRIKIELVLK
jgi:hypothetical protein